MRPNLFAALVVFFAVTLSTHDLFAQVKKVRLSLPSIGTNSMLFGLAAENGFFREEGLEVEQINMPGSLGVKALIGGDVGYSAASGSIITAALRGINVKLVSILSPVPEFRMIGQKEIKSMKDLKGKVVALSSRGGTLDHLTRIMLEKSGLVPDKDVMLVVVGVSRPYGPRSEQIVSRPLSLTCLAISFSVKKGSRISARRANTSRIILPVVWAYRTKKSRRNAARSWPSSRQR